MEDNDWLEALADLPEFESYGASNDEDIAHIQNELQLELPSSYVGFLRKYGCCDWDGNAVYGYYHGEGELREYYDVVIRTKEAWNDRFPKTFLPVPRNSLVLMSYGGGGFYMLACGSHPSPGSVFLILTETAHRIDDEWESIGTFIKEEFLA